MIMNPKITVAIPIYNAGEYLDYAIRSVLNQTFTDFELLLINDGSTDSSLEIMNKYIDDNRVQIINDGENKGLVYRLNQSIDLATGEYYARMDADDIMFPNRLEVQVEFLESNIDVDVIGASAISIDSKNTIIGLRKASNCWEKNVLVSGTRFIHPTVIGKTYWFKKNRYNPEWHRAEDYELWLRCLDHSKFINIDKPLLFYRELGIPTIRKYSASQKTLRKVLFDKDRLNVSLFYALKLFFISYVKVFVYSCFFLFNRVDLIVKKRSNPLDDQAKFYIDSFRKSIE